MAGRRPLYYFVTHDNAKCVVVAIELIDTVSISALGHTGIALAHAICSLWTSQYLHSWLMKMTSSDFNVVVGCYICTFHLMVVITACFKFFKYINILQSISSFPLVPLESVPSLDFMFTWVMYSRHYVYIGHWNLLSLIRVFSVWPSWWLYGPFLYSQVRFWLDKIKLKSSPFFTWAY